MEAYYASSSFRVVKVMCASGRMLKRLGRPEACLLYNGKPYFPSLLGMSVTKYFTPRSQRPHQFCDIFSQHMDYPSIKHHLGWGGGDAFLLFSSVTC